MLWKAKSTDGESNGRHVTRRHLQMKGKAICHCNGREDSSLYLFYSFHPRLSLGVEVMFWYIFVCILIGYVYNTVGSVYLLQLLSHFKAIIFLYIYLFNFTTFSNRL